MTFSIMLLICFVIFKILTLSHRQANRIHDSDDPEGKKRGSMDKVKDGLSDCIPNSIKTRPATSLSSSLTRRTVDSDHSRPNDESRSASEVLYASCKSNCLISLQGAFCRNQRQWRRQNNICRMARQRSALSTRNEDDTLLYQHWSKYNTANLGFLDEDKVVNRKG